MTRVCQFSILVTTIDLASGEIYMSLWENELTQRIYKKLASFTTHQSGLMALLSLLILMLFIGKTSFAANATRVNSCSKVVPSQLPHRGPRLEVKKFFNVVPEAREYFREGSHNTIIPKLYDQNFEERAVQLESWIHHHLLYDKIIEWKDLNPPNERAQSASRVFLVTLESGLKAILKGSLPHPEIGQQGTSIINPRYEQASYQLAKLMKNSKNHPVTVTRSWVAEGLSEFPFEDGAMVSLQAFVKPDSDQTTVSKYDYERPFREPFQRFHVIDYINGNPDRFQLVENKMMMRRNMVFSGGNVFLIDGGKLFSDLGSRLSLLKGSISAEMWMADFIIPDQNNKELAQFLKSIPKQEFEAILEQAEVPHIKRIEFFGRINFFSSQVERRTYINPLLWPFRMWGF